MSGSIDRSISFGLTTELGSCLLDREVKAEDYCYCAFNSAKPKMLMCEHNPPSKGFSIDGNMSTDRSVSQAVQGESKVRTRDACTVGSFLRSQGRKAVSSCEQN